MDIKYEQENFDKSVMTGVDIKVVAAEINKIQQFHMKIIQNTTNALKFHYILEIH